MFVAPRICPTLLAAALASALLVPASSGLSTVTLPASPGSLPASPEFARLSESFGRLPLSFEANQGQAAPEVQFLARGAGYTLFLSHGEAVLALRAGAKSEKSAKGGTPDTRHLTPNTQHPVLRMKLLGANPSSIAHGLEPLPGIVNYFIGDDPAKWRTKIPTYAKIQYKAVYPGIDLVYYGTSQRQLEYDFVVAPGADPKQIALSFEGADEAGGQVSGARYRVEENGDLALTLNGVSGVGVQGSGEEDNQAVLRFKKPVVYQVIDGQRRDLEGSYVLRTDGDRPPSNLAESDLSRVSRLSRSTDPSRTSRSPRAATVAFSIPEYDPAYPLIIDPILANWSLAYSSYLGGNGDDTAYDIAADSSGNMYVTGSTTSTSSLATAGVFDTSQNGGTDVFVAKLDATGATLVYATYLGGAGDDRGRGIVVDSGGAATVTGIAGAGFPLVRGNPFVPTNAYAGGNSDAFVAKLSSTGASLLNSTYYGGAGDDVGLDVVLKSTGTVVIAGWSTSAGFLFAGSEPSPVQSAHGQRDAFVLEKSTTSASVSRWTFLGGPGADTALAVAVDPSDNVYVTGWTTGGLGVLGDLGTQAAQRSYGGGSTDGFVIKLNTAFTVTYATYLGGSERDEGRGIVVSTGGEAFVTGLTFSYNFPVRPVPCTSDCPFQQGYGGNGDAFLTRLSSRGSGFLRSSFLGGNGLDAGNGLAYLHDGTNEFFAITGVTQSKAFPTDSNAPYFRLRDSASSTSGGDVFLTIFGSAVNFPFYSTYLGGASYDAGQGVVMDAAGNVYVTGATRSSTFSLVNPRDTSLTGASDAFVAKFGQGSPVPGSATFLCGTLAASDLQVGQTVTPQSSLNSPLIFTGPLDLTYTLSVSNFSGTATSVSLVDWLPGGAQFVSVSSSGNLCGYTAGDHQVLCTMGNIAGGVTEQVSLTVRLSTFLPRLLNTISAQPRTCEADHNFNRSSVITRFAPAVGGQNYTLTITKQGTGVVISSNVPGITCGSDCQETFKAGTVVALNPILQPNSQGLVFKGWSGTGCGPIVNMNANRICTAIFGPADPATLTLAGTFTPTYGGGFPGSSPNEITLTTSTYVSQSPLETGFSGTMSAVAYWSGSPDQTLHEEMFRTLPHPFTGVDDSSLQVPFTVTFSTDPPFSIEGGNPITINPSATLGDDPPPNAVVLGFTPTQNGPVTGEVRMHWQASCAGCSFDTALAIAAVASSTADSTAGLVGSQVGDGTSDPVQHALTVAKNGDGTVSTFGDLTQCQSECTSLQASILCGEACSASYDAGTTVTLYAKEGPLTAFDHWEGCMPVAGDPETCTVAMTAARAVTAFFTPAIPVIIEATDLTATEAGLTTGQFKVSRTGTSGSVALSYTVSGTASPSSNCPAGGDYVTLPGSVTIANGQTSATITVTPCNDIAVEGPETVTVKLNVPPTGYKLGAPDEATVTITSDDLPNLTINDVTVTEGNTGTVNASFTVTLTPGSGQQVTVQYATANGTATAGSDYVALPLTTLTFTPGQTSKTVTVLVNGDTLDEANETFFVNLSNATNATITDSQGVGTITDNDPAPNLTINDVTVTEGNTGTVNASFTVTLTPGSGQQVTVQYATANGTATAGSDYVALPLTTLTFTPGQTSKTVTVLVNGDTLDEANETFFVNLSNATNATIADSQGIGTITDDDSLLSVTKGGNGAGTVSSTPAGVTCGPGCPSTNATFTTETQVTLTAAPYTGSMFMGWGGACNHTPDTSPTCVVTMNKAKTAKATFRALPVKPPRPSRTVPSR